MPPIALAVLVPLAIAAGPAPPHRSSMVAVVQTAAHCLLQQEFGVFEAGVVGGVDP